VSTDQRRYQVFVSSTYLDLREARQAVTAALLECDAFPAGMELFPAADDDAWTLIKKVIDESDYYLLVIAGKYGSVDPAEGISFTEKEFDYAVSTNRPVMAFLHGEPGSLKADLSERTEEAQKLLAAFREKVTAAKHVKYWTSPDQLAGQVALTYNKFTRLYPATGWIRADRATSTESLQALADARSRIDDLQQQLGTARTSAPAGTENLVQGQDKISLPLYAKGNFDTTSGAYKAAGRWFSVHTSWDELFAGVAPRLPQECEESALRTAMQEVLASEHYSKAVEAVLVQSKEDGLRPKAGSVRRLTVDLGDDDFGTTLVQFMALGLIRRSERKRSVNDTNTYWALTPYGETRTIQLRAMKRGEVKDDEHDLVIHAVVDGEIVDPTADADTPG
jgi:hypothetical protein